MATAAALSQVYISLALPLVNPYAHSTVKVGMRIVDNETPEPSRPIVSQSASNTADMSVEIDPQELGFRRMLPHEP